MKYLITDGNYVTKGAIVENAEKLTSGGRLVLGVSQVKVCRDAAPRVDDAFISIQPSYRRTGPTRRR